MLVGNRNASTSGLRRSSNGDGGTGSDTAASSDYSSAGR